LTASEFKLTPLVANHINIRVYEKLNIKKIELEDDLREK